MAAPMSGTAVSESSDEQRAAGILAGFAPWIVYWILIGNVNFRLAILIAFAVAAVETVKQYLDGRQPQVLEVGSTIAFAILVIIAYSTDDVFLERWIQPIANGALLAIALGSILVGRPFVLGYAKQGTPPEVWDNPGFLRTVTVITWVWVAAFAVMTVSALIPPIVDGDSALRDEDDTLSIIFYWVIPIIALVGAIWFSKWYPERSRARVQVA
jgi:hypothetical protein